MSSWPPSLADFYALAISPAACVPDTRAVRSINVGAQLFELPGHGFSGGETLYFQTSGVGSAVPTGLSTATAYLAVRSNSHFFGVTNLDGSPATFSDAGAGLVNVLQDMEPVILANLARDTSRVQSRAKAYKPPYTGTVPAMLTGIACDLTAFAVATRMRVASPQFSVDDIRRKYETALADLAGLDRGEPLAEDVIDATPPIAESGPKLIPLAHRGDFDLPRRGGDCGLDIA